MSSLLVKGNAKLGDGIWTFSTPRLVTCPGATDACKQVCYGKAFKRYPNVEKTHNRMLDASKQDDFVEKMVEEIKESGAKIVRIHVLGDFYSLSYTRKWIRIVRSLPDVVFYAYTRSFACPRILPALNDLRTLPNMVLWWAVDKTSTAQPPEGRIAYMSLDDEDLPPEEASLVFRVMRKTKKVKLNGVFVCPKETGKPTKDGLHCDSCKYCFKDAL